MSFEKSSSGYYSAQLRDLKRAIASLEKAIDRNEDRITKIRRTQTDWHIVSTRRMQILQSLVENIYVLTGNVLPYLPSSESDGLKE